MIVSIYKIISQLFVFNKIKEIVPKFNLELFDIDETSNINYDIDLELGMRNLNNY
jgi:hypothetical protein